MNNKEKDLETPCPYHCNEKYGQCNNPSPGNKYIYCFDYKDCIYKLYAHKEQELEYYKIQFNADTKEMDGYQNEIARHLESIEYLRTQLRTKEQECERLKKLYKELQDDMLICRKCKATFYLKKYANKDSECLELQHKVNILKQTLTEIKEYCIQQNLKADYTACEILQKINKVIDEN